MKSQNRIYLYDNLKFVLIVLVVLGHFINGYTTSSRMFSGLFQFIYAFHMPLFLFISGHFHKNNKPFLKIFSLCCIGFVIKIVLALFTLIVNHSAPSFSLLSDHGLPWYMFVLAAHTLISYLCRNMNKRFLMIMAILLACFVGYDAQTRDYLYLSRILVFYPFYLLGEMIPQDGLLRIHGCKWAKAFGLIPLGAWIFLCFFRLDAVDYLLPLFTGRNPFFVNAIFEKWGFLYRLACYAITLVVGFAVFCLIPNRQFPIVTHFGSRTLQVYFWHWPVLMIFNKLGIGAFLCSSPLGKLCWLLCGVTVTCLLSLKPFGFPVTTIIKNCTTHQNKGVAN